MTNAAPRLRAYVRRTILKSARDGAYPKKRRTPESTRAAFMDALHGTDTGWWSDLIYTAPMLNMASRYRNEIRAVVREYLEEADVHMSAFCDRNRTMTYADVIAATAERCTWDDYMGEAGDRGEALLFGLRFAVEYLAADVARDYCPEHA